MNKEFIKRVAKIQSELKAPKGQFNKFGKYNYRSCEDIMEGVKPLLDGLVLTVNDELQQAADRIYIKATATLTDGESSISNSALARESLTKKGMDDSQITGTASSYARKYALNGLFCIDDTKDADSMDNRASQTNEPTENDKPWYNEPDYQRDLQGITEAVRNGTSPDAVIKQLTDNYKVSNEYRNKIKSI